MVLLKKVVTHECPTFRCEPVCRPSCGCTSDACGCTGDPCFEPAPLPPDVPAEAPETQPKKPPVPPSASLPRLPARKTR
jgi:hypothetical protein